MRLLCPASLLLALHAAALPAQALQETWETGYTKGDATGTHVLGYWRFDGEGDAALKDASGKGGDVALQGAVLHPQGRFGGGLECFPGFPVDPTRHAAVTSAKPALSPKGAFTLEMWVKPKAEFMPQLRCYLLDKKYVNHTDYQWQLMEESGGQRRMMVTLGFGSESKMMHSEPLKFTADTWQHLAFTYNGAGTGKFYFNGTAAGGTSYPGYGPVVTGAKPLSIGDRIGSNYGGFPGIIDEVRICDGMLSFERVALQITSSRQVWRRLEASKPVEIQCTNLQRQVLKDARLVVDFGGKTETFQLPELAPGTPHTVKFSVNTALKAEKYKMNARLEAGDYATEQGAEFQLVPRLAPRMPVIMWGGGPEEMDRMKDIGFTHFIGLRPDVMDTWTQKKPMPAGRPEVIEASRRDLDAALANGLEVVASISPGRDLAENPKYQRVDRAGKPYSRAAICASLPEFPSFFQNVGTSVAKAYGDHPAFTTALLDTEVRDASQPSFNPVDVENYRKFANADIPAEVVFRSGVEWTKLKDFPADRVVEDDHPILKYYRWFWTVGDGWNALHTALHKGVKSSGRRDLWTFFDPAVRQPSISGAGGGVDVLSHWTYTYPDPQKIGLCADQLFAMSAASGRNQQVMKMTQLIWYRSQTAPINPKAPNDPVPWDDHDTDAAYITIAPMHLKEALWTKIARPIQGIMYHGWQSLVPTRSVSGYRFTNPSTAPVLKQLLHEVIEPLGPTLMAIPDERSEVALLESFTSQMFARRGGYGSNIGWAADVWLALQHAHVQTDILYEETVLQKNGLSGRKFLVMPNCDVLTKSTVARIQEWQKKGGKIIADDTLCPGLKADILLATFKREKKADADKAKVLDLAKTLGSHALPQKARCDNPEIIVRTRKFGDALYVFVVNDHRENGTYVGQRNLVMENGLPSRGTVGVKSDTANVYDLTGTQFILPKRGDDGTLSWPVELGPCDGRIFMVLPKPLLGIKLDAEESATVGNTARVNVRITTTQDAPTKAVIPVRITIRDASGKTAEGSGHYAAENGIVELDLNLAPNEDPGTWEIRVKELASGMEAVKWMTVKQQP